MGDLAVYGGTWEPLRNHEHWDWTTAKGGLGLGSKLPDIAYFGKLSKLGEKKFFWGLTTPGSTSAGFF